MPQNEKKYCVELCGLTPGIGSSNIEEIYSLPFIPRKGEIISFKCRVYEVDKVIYFFEKENSTTELTYISVYLTEIKRRKFRFWFQKDDD